MEQFRIDHGCYTLTCGGASAFQYALPGDECIELQWPSFLTESGRTGASVDWSLESEAMLNAGIRQYAFAGRLSGGLMLRMELRTAKGSPIIRFRYILSSAEPYAMVSTDGRDITYLSYQTCTLAKQMEIRFSNYDSVIHGYCLNELPAFDYEDEVMGPILAEERASISLLSVYEHPVYRDLLLYIAGKLPR